MIGSADHVRLAEKWASHCGEPRTLAMTRRFATDPIHGAHRADGEDKLTKEFLPTHQTNFKIRGLHEFARVHGSEFRFAINPRYKPWDRVSALVDGKTLHKLWNGR